jgi:hypothetical protein
MQTSSTCLHMFTIGPSIGNAKKSTIPGPSPLAVPLSRRIVPVILLRSTQEGE